MEALIKAAAVSVTAALVGTVLKKDSPGIFVLIGASSVGVAVYLLFNALSEVTDFINLFTDSAQIDEDVISVLLKITLIAIVSGFASDVCKDAGMNAAASAALFAGETISVYLSLPLIKTVFKLFSDYI